MACGLGPIKLSAEAGLALALWGLPALDLAPCTGSHWKQKPSQKLTPEAGAGRGLTYTHIRSCLQKPLLPGRQHLEGVRAIYRI